MAKSYVPRFVCPECRCEKLVEVRHFVEQTIAAIDSNSEIIRDKRFSHCVEPEDISYRCLDCGYVPKDQMGDVVHGTERLCDWLTKQADARMTEIRFTCPSCGGNQIDDNVEIDDEGYCSRIFRCHHCGEDVTDQEEAVLREMIRWAQKCVEKCQDGEGLFGI